MSDRRAEPSRRPNRLVDWHEILQCYLWFFLVLFSYYLLKPVRDGYGSALAAHMGDLYLATFLSTVVLLPLYSQLVGMLSRWRFVNGVTQFFVLCLVGFVVGFHRSTEPPAWLIATFFVWVSVFNLFIVTVFWSVMADLHTSEQAKTWFGSMAAAGSVGALSGSAVALQLSKRLDPYLLLLAAILCLEFIAVNAWWLLKRRTRRVTSTETAAAQVTREKKSGNRSPEPQSPDEQQIGGGMWTGISAVFASPYLFAICLFVALGKFAATFVYNNLQIALNASMPDAQQRTILFSQMNIWSQSGSMILQGIGVTFLMRWAGVGFTLVIPCLVLLGLFLWLSIQATVATLVVGQVTQQVLGYGLLVPAQHVLFTVVSREEKYKTKAFVDTVVFRGSDVAAGKLCQWMTSTGTALSVLSLWMLPTIVIWVAVAIFLGRGYLKKRGPLPA